MTTVTWIAPVVESLPKLALLEELGRIAKINGVVIKTATGKVLLDDVANALNTSADVLVWSGHGEPDGLLLSDGRKVRSKWLATQISQACRPHVAILAACGSQQRDAGLNSFAAAICRQGINVVGFPAEASDVAAGTFIVEYVRSLSLGASVMDGFDVALEAIDNEDTARGVFLTPGMRNIPLNIEEDLLEMIRILQRIETRLVIRAADTGDGNTTPPDFTGESEKAGPTIRPLMRGRGSDNIRGMGLVK